MQPSPTLGPPDIFGLFTSITEHDQWSGKTRVVVQSTWATPGSGRLTYHLLVYLYMQNLLILFPGMLYAVGGYDGASRQCLSTVECYNYSSNEWSYVAEMGTRRSGAGE